MTQPSSFIIGVAGGSGGGKSTLARLMLETAGYGTLLELDRFYHSADEGPEDANRNFDHPDAIDFDLVYSVLTDLHGRGRALVPVYDFASHARIGFEPLTAAPLVIVEGILALWPNALRARFDVCVFVDAPDHVRLSRRVRRDERERGRDSDSVNDQWSRQVMPMHQQFVEPTKEFADIVIDGESDLLMAASHVVDYAANLPSNAGHPVRRI